MANTAELLTQLRDIRVPEPPAEPPVWPLIIATIAIAIGVITLLQYFQNKHASWAGQARQEIKAAQKQTPDVAIQTYANLLKRIVLTLQPTNDTQTLHGTEWLQHLDKVFSTTYFTREQGRVFGVDLYRPQAISEADRDAIAVKLQSLMKRRSWRLW